MAGPRTGAGRKEHRYTAKYVIRRDGQWSKPQKGKFRVNPEIFKTTEDRVRYIEITAAATHKVGNDDVVVVTYQSSFDDQDTFSLPADEMATRMEAGEAENPIPVPSRETIAAMSADDVLEAVDVFSLTDPAKFDAQLPVADLRFNLAEALHGEAPEE